MFVCLFSFLVDVQEKDVASAGSSKMLSWFSYLQLVFKNGFNGGVIVDAKD